MKNVDSALAYATRGLPVFPVLLIDGKKIPGTPHGYKDATTDRERIAEWWAARPAALIGMPTGRQTGMVVLDIDVKNGAHGWDSLEELGALPLPHTPHAHTPNGGCHVYFQAPAWTVRCSAGKIGAGLDIRADGGSIILPAAGGRYRWDPHLSLDAVPLAPMPEWLVKAVQPAPVERIVTPAPVMTLPGLSRYGRAALDGAGHDIIAAPAGQQETTLNGKGYWIGQLVAGGEIPFELARDALIYAAAQMPNHVAGNPWQHEDLTRKVNAALAAGMNRPVTAPKESTHAA
ncbi:MAG: bifunctional DNA primase/polymerase [Achromobacter sp.]|uniref:bifunctional DNA primase/polymerase n=1 Tax=Achromobacter sp. TaxID=134375 RepID=UPI0025867A27|nr:bifunctional DNA primase/polymerase [Achromobacter sp.]MCW0206022.1 bifunctional DNA primase/polymerase [Achromobacter sp.]